ncbi:MAG: cobalamin-dependent protein [Chitinispirillaceae bacterium]|nr:cobalamin-dependent protein [Chitinispirillaceae bacterium]
MDDKILVINPPYQMFPIGIAYVLACLENHGVRFDFADAQFGNGYKRLLKKNDYRAVATGGLIAQFKFFQDVFRSVREINPQTPVILGGNITKDMRSEFLFDKLGITYGIIGEAETSLPFLLDAMMKKETSLDTIPGLLYKDLNTGEIKKNPVRRLDLSNTNILPAWHWINVDYYINVWEYSIFGRRLAMPVISARGCIGACTFCSPLMGAFRKRPVEHVIQEIEFLNARYTFDWIAFFSEMFYATKKDIVNFCEAYKMVKPQKKWLCDLRADADIDEETLRLMKECGCADIFVGIESGSNKILKSMNKRTTKEQVIHFYRIAKSAGLPCDGNIMVGNEDETEADIKETVDMVIDEEMNAQERLTNAYPGTKMFENAVKCGLAADGWESLQRFDFECYIWDYNLTKKQYINITGIPNEKFWEIIIRELRRFNTHISTRYNAKDMTYVYKFGLLIKVTGVCADCGNAVTLAVPRKTLGIRTSCRNCYRPVMFNLYELKEFNGHYRLLCAELQKAKQLAIAGTKIEASFMLRYDYFKLSYGSLLGFIEMDQRAPEVSEFIHMPRYRMTDLLDVRPDTILIVDDPFGDAEMKLRYFYLRKKQPPPRILHLLPEVKRPHRRVIDFVRKHAAATTGNIFLVTMAIQLPLFISGTKARILNSIKSNYIALNRNNWIRSILTKVQQ